MRKIWTDADDALLKNIYPDTQGKIIAERMGRSLSSIYARAQILGLEKSDAFKKSEASGGFQKGRSGGIATQFKKGHVPANKGKKGWDAGGRSHETRFKKGHRPQTWVPIGSERITKDGYRQTKITDTGYTPRDWKGNHILLWEKHYGEIPKGFSVCFIDGNKENIILENLALLSRSDLMRRNSFHNKYPKEIGLAIMTRAALVRKINRRERREEQNRRSA